MNSRIEIRIAILGEPKAGKETFAKMLFLDNPSKIRIDPLSKLAEMYMEIDPINFQHSSKKIMEECKDHYNLLMKQTQMKDPKQLRENKIDPIFYKHTPRVRGLIDYSDISQYINRNVLLTFYFIGNNYLDFENEIEMANILVYIVDINTIFDVNSNLFQYLVGSIKNNTNKYMITIVNKCDNLNSNGEFDMLANNKNNSIDLLFSNSPAATEANRIILVDETLREVAQQYNIHANLSPPIPMSCKYACIYRQINFSIPCELSHDDRLFIANQYVVKKDFVQKDIQRFSNKYFKRSGYTAFQDYLLDILSSKYKNMVDHNYGLEVKRLDPSLYTTTDEFIMTLINIKNKSLRLTKIFKKNYDDNVTNIIKNLLNTIAQSTDPNLALVDTIKDIYNDNKEIISLIASIKGSIYGKIIENTTNKLYAKEITPDIFMPTNVHILFDKLFNSYPPRDQITRLAIHICELYSFRARMFLSDQNKNYFDMLYNTYFEQSESKKLMSMLNEIKSMMKFDSYKIYLIQIFLTKLMVVEKCVENKATIGLEKMEEIVSYCKSLKYHLSDNNHRKYDYLFNNISDVCTQAIFNLAGIHQLNYISKHVESIINFKPDRVIDLDKFIVKMIKKTNYQAVVADDENDSDEDSDVDIYGEEDNDDDDDNNFKFTKDDLVESDNEETVYVRSKQLNDDKDQIEI